MSESVGCSVTGRFYADGRGSCDPGVPSQTRSAEGNALQGLVADPISAASPGDSGAAGGAAEPASLLACAPILSPSLAIVVPCLDEVKQLRILLPALQGVADEVIVSDGGSRDGSPTLARDLGATVVAGPPGRGGQLNRGAAAAGAGVLLFLHADTRLPAGAGPAVRAACAGGAVGGGFRVRFDSGGFLLERVGSSLVNLRTRLTRLPLGDQAQFATRAAFEALGGYPDWPILEDLDFMRRLKRHGRTVLLTPPVVTSARRYLAGGKLATVSRNWCIVGLYACGVAPQRLARLYDRGLADRDEP